MERKSKKSVVLAAVVAACVSPVVVGEIPFLSQEELEARLDELRREEPPWLGCVIRDRFYRPAERVAMYEYKCPECGRSTEYQDEVGERCMPGVSNRVAWARESVDKLRALRLDVKADERGYCDYCRSALKIPDGGRIVQIPDDWPERPTMRIFPFSIGDEVLIVGEPYDNVFRIARKTQPYWVPSAYVTEDWKLTGARLLPVHVGPGKKFPQIGSTNRWHPGRVVPNSETNGWVRYDGDFPMTVEVTKDVVGDLVFAGADTQRYDVRKLRWTINGRAVDIYDETDILILETFLRGERQLPNWDGPDSDIRTMGHRARLEELLRARHRARTSRVWSPSPSGQTSGKHSPTGNYDNIEVEVEFAD